VSDDSAPGRREAARLATAQASAPPSVMPASPSGRFLSNSRAARRVRIAVLCVIGAAGLSSCKRAEPAAKVETAPPATAAAPTAAAVTTNAPAAALPEPVRKLLGRWLRSDGGYTLELKSAELSGVLQAGYFNPKSIHVSRAIWMQGATGFQVVVELNDVGYPGATYVLSYDPQTDQLAGKYNQPAMQQSFDIEFIRQK